LDPKSQNRDLLSGEIQAKKALEFARALFEKCELSRSKESFLEALAYAKRLGDPGICVQTISGLLRLAAEANDQAEIEKWNRELDVLLDTAPQDALPGAWYCKGVVASYSGQARLSYRYYFRAWKHCHQLLAHDHSAERLNEYLKIWSNLVYNFFELGLIERAEYTVDLLFRRYENLERPGVNGPLYMIKGRLAEVRRQLDVALSWYQKAHVAFLKDRDWHSHIYVLYAYARLYRLQGNYPQAYWYLDLASKAVGEEFISLNQTLSRERERLENDAIDLLIDSRSLIVSTREQNEVPLGKQYVLLGILEALTEVHEGDAEHPDRGLSKAELIERVWKEKYRPEAHDNKLYYNINRLRKLIEPDMRHPKYLLNWKEGYRLAPGLKVHLVKTAEMRVGE